MSRRKITPQQRYARSAKGRRARTRYRQGETLRRENATPAARARRARYRKTRKGRAADHRYNHSPKGQETRRMASVRYNPTPLGRERNCRYNHSPLGNERAHQWRARPKGKEANWRSKHPR